MSYLIVCDHSEYKIAKLVEAHKNHIQVTMYPDEAKRKFGIKQQIYEIKASDINQFATQITQVDIDVPLLFELIEDTTNYITISDLSHLVFW